MEIFDLPEVLDLLRLALAEDVGAGDVTTRVTIDPATAAQAQVRVKQDTAVLAGVPLLRRLASLAGATATVQELIGDGRTVVRGDVVAILTGPAHALLTLERVSLNLLQHLSGIATLTSRYVAAVAGTKARIVDTRKTLPGLRTLQKYAVRAGGGFNHRHRLDDGILIKNNHITAAGGLAAAVHAARAAAPHGLKVEVECRTLADVDAALASGAEAILLDNMDVEQLRAAVERIAGRALTEASGGVNLDSVRALAETGVDLISIGALTHSVPAVDLHMLLELV